MAPASVCPKCGYARQASDTAPDWQCPSCGVAIEKYRALQQADAAVVQKSIEAAAGAAAAMSAAAANPVTAALVTQQHWIETPPRLPLERRLGAAFPDIALAALFLWCWIAPHAWRPTLAGELGLMLLMEFFALHSSVFLVAGSGEGGTGAKIMVAFFVMLFYIPVAGAFAWWHGGWWPVLAFVWLLGSRVATMLSGQGSDAFEEMRGRYYWGTAGAFYIIGAFAALLLPMPRLGFDWKTSYQWPAFWRIPPWEVMAWGVLYFGALGLAKLLEKPEWIVAEPEDAT